MDLNLKQLKDLKLYPFLSCVKNTGPLDSTLMTSAISGVSQDKINTITAKENTMSNARFRSELKGSSRGIVLKVRIGMIP